MTARITTAGTAIAERLDVLTAFNDASKRDDSPFAATSTVEELTTALLLRHQLNQPSMYFEPVGSAWDAAAAGECNGDADADADGDAELPDEPPF